MLDTSMLVRSHPFREWITVYYDSTLITEQRLLSLLRERRCASATLDRQASGDATAMNPFAGPGDLVQVRLADAAGEGIDRVELPEGWQMVGDASGFRADDGRRYYLVRVSAAAEPGPETLTFHRSEGEPLWVQVEVVRKVGD